MALATKPLSSLSSFSTPSPIPNRNSFLLHPKFHSRALLPLIICKSTQTDAVDYPLSVPELDGSGAAAPTRGDLFLQTHHSSTASSAVLAEIKKNKKKEKKNLDKAAKLPSSIGPSCYGCGAPLQKSEPDAPGYIEPETYNLVSYSVVGKSWPEFMV